MVRTRTKSAVGALVMTICQWLLLSPIYGQNRPVVARTAYSALYAGIGTLWLTQENGSVKKHGFDSLLIYNRGGTTAVQALLAGEIEFGHLSPAPGAH